MDFFVRLVWGRGATCLALCAACLTLGAIAGCGSNDSSTGPAQGGRKQDAKPVEKRPSSMSKAEIAGLPDLVVKAASGPAPKRLVVRDLRKGTGAAIEPGNSMRVDFVGVNYGEGLKASPGKDYRPTEFGFEEVIKGWREGLPGMRVGGRRELTVPPGLGDAGRTAVYVIDLLAIRSR